MLCEIVAIANRKSGTGKSTTAEALAAGLFLKGKKVLLIDLDPKGSITLTSGADYSKPTIYELLMGETDAQAVVQQRTQQVDIIPASQNLSFLDIILTATDKKYRLKKVLEPLKNSYDYIVIDTPLTVGLLTVNSLTASDSLIIPSQADLYSLQGIEELYDTVETIKEYTNPALIIKGILLTRCNSRSILSREMTEMTQNTAEQLNTFLYNVFIREAVAIREAQATKQNIFAYAPKSRVANDYRRFVNEFLERSGK